MLKKLLEAVKAVPETVPCRSSAISFLAASRYLDIIYSFSLAARVGLYCKFTPYFYTHLYYTRWGGTLVTQTVEMSGVWFIHPLYILIGVRETERECVNSWPRCQSS